MRHFEFHSRRISVLRLTVVSHKHSLRLYTVLIANFFPSLTEYIITEFVKMRWFHISCRTVRLIMCSLRISRSLVHFTSNFPHLFICKHNFIAQFTLFPKAKEFLCPCLCLKVKWKSVKIEFPLLSNMTWRPDWGLCSEKFLTFWLWKWNPSV